MEKESPLEKLKPRIESARAGEKNFHVADI
jgi:hypothetical protein